MTPRARGARRWILIATLIGLGAGAASGASNTREMREAMRDFAASLSVLLEASTQPDLTASRDDDSALSEALLTVNDHATLLVEHLERDDTAFLAAALTTQVRLLRASARRGNHALFTQSLDRTIGTCVRCHDLTSSAGAGQLARRLVPQRIEDALPQLRRARLQIGTRRFEAARGTLETAMRTLEGDTLRAAFTDYLMLSVRMLEQPELALAQIDRLSAAKRLPDTELSAWRKSLQQWPKRAGTVPDLGLAARALARARAHSDKESGRVDYLLAAMEARRWLERGTGDDRDASEANLILGVTEHALSTDAWLPLPELYLEQAVRLAPEWPSAKEAVDALRSVLVERFGGAALPGEVADHLEKLEQLVRDARGRA